MTTQTRTIRTETVELGADVERPVADTEINESMLRESLIEYLLRLERKVKQLEDRVNITSADQIVIRESLSRAETENLTLRECNARLQKQVSELYNGIVYVQSRMGIAPEKKVIVLQ